MHATCGTIQSRRLVSPTRSTDAATTAPSTFASTRNLGIISRSLATYRSVLAEFPGRFPEVGSVRETLHSSRFYDGFRVDAGAQHVSPR